MNNNNKPRNNLSLSGFETCLNYPSGLKIN